MLFPTVPKIRMRFENYLARLEIAEAGIADCSRRLNVGSSIFGAFPELDELKARCVHVHAVLNQALDGLYQNSVSARQLDSRLPNIDREVVQLEMIIDKISRSISATKAI